MNSVNRRATLVACATVFTATCVLYGLFLQRVPPYLSHDEIVFSLSAHSIATTGHDLQGRLLADDLSELGFDCSAQTAAEWASRLR